MGRKHYNQKEKELIKSLYNQGLDTVQISKQVGKSQSGVERLLKKEGIYIKKTYRHKIPHSEDENIKHMYLVDNKTTKQIAKCYDVQDTAILKMLNRWGINTSDTEKYSKAKNLTAFENIDSELKAYLLGFILADGNITIPAARPNSMLFQLEIQQKDNQVLYWLADLLEYPQECIYTYQRNDPNRQPTSKISLYSKTLCESLAQYSIVPRKAHTCKLPIINPELNRHMIRGLIDGDGSVLKSKIALSGNTYVIDSVIDIYKALDIPEDAIKIYETTSKVIVVSQKEYRELLGSWLYNDCNFYLKRKAHFYREVVEKNTP